MLFTRSGFRLFAKFDLGAVLEAQTKKIEEEVLADSSVVNLKDEEKYIQNLVEEKSIARVVLDPSKIKVDLTKAMIPAKYFPSSFGVDRGEEYEKKIAVFSVPFSGDKELLESKPSTFMLWSEEVSVEDNCIVFEIIVFSDDADSLKKERDDIVGKIQQRLDNINQQVDGYNETLNQKITGFVKQSKENHKKDSDLLSELNS